MTDFKISLIHPSRSRPEKSAATILKWKERWVDLDENPLLVDYVISLDSSDPKLNEYGLTKVYSKKSIIVNDNTSAVDAINAGAKAVNGDVLIVVSDDTDCPVGWNNIIYHAMNGRSGLLKVFDGAQKWICTMPVMSRDYYEEQGYIYNPAYQHMFCDTHLTHVADLKKKLIIRNDIVFHHDHYSVSGAAKDAVTNKANSTWNKGKRLYLLNCKSKFGMGNIDIFNLSPEAHQAGHVGWLKKELRKFR